MGNFYYITPLKGGPPPWSPSDLANKLYWYRSDNVTLSGPTDVTFWPTKTIGTPGIDLNFGSVPSPQYSTNVVNGKPAILFQEDSQADSTSPQNEVVLDINTPWALTYVHKGPSLTLGTYYSLVIQSGAFATESATLFYTNLSGLPVFYYQVGDSTVEIISIPDFDITQWHSIIINYNGGGDLKDPTNYTIYLNGISQTVSSVTSSGGDSPANKVGDASAGLPVDAGYYTELISVTNGNILGTDLTDLLTYYNARYGV